jgi:hypothetical protein
VSDVNRDEPVVRGPKPTAPPPAPAGPPTGAAKRPGRPGPRRRPKAAGGTQPPGKKKHTKRIAVIAGTAALTTAVSGIVGGLVSPERVQSVLGLSDGETTAADDTPTGPTSAPGDATTSDGPEALEFKRVQDPTRAISLDVPAPWATAKGIFDGIDGVDSPGAALRIGPDPTAESFVSEETIWVGASTQAFDDLNLDDYDDMGVPVLLAQRREAAASYLAQAGCVPTPAAVPDLGERWIGAARAWQDCSSIPGWRAIEIEMITAARDAYVFVQIGLAPDTPDEVAQRVVDSLTILAPNLPVS